jgi:hypothetical protein
VPLSPVSVNGRLLKVDLVDVVEHDLGLEALGVLQEALHQLRALHAVDVGRPVVHLGGGHQLAALRDAGDQQGFEVCAGRVDGGGVAGGAGAEDQNFGVLGGHGRKPVWKNATGQCTFRADSREVSTVPGMAGCLVFSIARL